VTARFNQTLTDALLADCFRALNACEIHKNDIVSIRVPGSFELPSAAAKLIEKKLDAIVCLGVIIKGETSHDQHIANAVAINLGHLSIKEKIPVIFGVLTTENLAQAEVRAAGEQKKGWEAGMSAVEMALLFQTMSPP
jgi:6,7-dimethyl-8-ribityllumazine synthase